MVAVNNSSIASKIKDTYSLEDLEALWNLLRTKGTLTFPALKNGLFSAATVASSTEYTGYSAVWIRDNIHVAHAHYRFGTAAEQQTAVGTVKRLADFLHSERVAFERAIDSGHAPSDQMMRPHIRFRGETLEKIEQEWNHAQNDALGYFLWFFCELAIQQQIALTAKDCELIALFPLYFESIKYWQDEDSGHWEEVPKVEASSIGTVVAGLKSMRELLRVNESLRMGLGDGKAFQRNRTAFQGNRSKGQVTTDLLNTLIIHGERALAQILPWESIQPGKERRYDAALLFLIYPLKVTTDQQSAAILSDVIDNLQGEYGISRYQGDSFWCRDYQDIPENIRTTIATEREEWMKAHNRTLQAGEEAQWCIFDPIISAIYGQQYLTTQDPLFLNKQIHYFNRSLGQLTAQDSPFGDSQCPELYYLQRGKYIPGDATPLLWTQANLLTALKQMKESIR